MEKRNSSSSPGGGIAGQLRDLLHVGGSKERVTPELRTALDLLNLATIDDLENHFLGTDCFLKPWSHFRDTWFLLQTRLELRASPPNQLQPSSILWFYTCFLEGELRYDPRGDEKSPHFTPDTTVYGTFDDQYWGVEEHEKLLYSWLLQEFRVGKARNPFGIGYFEHRNVITAWRDVFVPIVDAVRNSYDVRGRRHYGRIANFIENRYPSRLAFPEGNVATPMHSTRPYRVVSASRVQGSRPWAGSSTQSTSVADQAIAKKEYANFEKELREVYPKYGQVVERPKFKTRMEDWLAGQKLRAQQKKRHKELHNKKTPESNKSGGESPMFGCRGLWDPQQDNIQSESNQRSVPRRSMSYTTATPSVRSMGSSVLFAGTPNKEELHGYGPSNVFLQFHDTLDSHKFRAHLAESQPDIVGRKHPSMRHSMDYGPGQQPGLFDPRLSPPKFELPPAAQKYTTRLDGDAEDTSDKLDNTNLLDLGGHSQRSANVEPYDGIFGTTQRSSLRNNFLEKSGQLLDQQKLSESSKHMCTVLSSFFNHKVRSQVPAESSKESSFVCALNAAKDRPPPPSYRGGHFYEGGIPCFPANNTVLPRDENGIAYYIPQRVPWPGQSPDFPPRWNEPWPESEEDEGLTPPPVPSKNPHRYNSFGSPPSAESSRPSPFEPPAIPNLGPRIVSAENIRAHLKMSPQPSKECLNQTVEPAKKAAPVPLLRTYNSHMFPKKKRVETQIFNESMPEIAEPYAGGSYEMDVLDQSKKE